MKTYISGAHLVTPQQSLPGMNVVLENGKIGEISASPLKPEKGSVQIDGGGMYLCPGFIDVHIHGAMQMDTMDAEPGSLAGISRYCAEHGVTAFYPTTWSSSPGDILAAIQAVQESQGKLPGAAAPGVHLEGPYINASYRGAQAPAMIRNPVKEEYEQWFRTGAVRLITLAPEIPGGMELVKAAAANQVRLAIGHSAATYDQVIAAANAGVTQATHLFNGMGGLHHREPGTVGGILDDERIFAQIICDGIHLHPAVVRLILKAKSAARVILITDSVSGAGLLDGDYEHNGQKFFVRDGTVRTPDGGLAGSTIALDGALRNMMTFTGKPLPEILPMLTSSPAEAMGISGSKGFIQAGYDADLVLLNKQFHVEMTLVNGKVVYSRN